MEKEKKIHLLVTGASRGIGREICENLSKFKHFAVYGVGRSKIKINNFNYFALDISKKNSLNLLSKKIPKLDVLINNAGITKDNLLMRMNEEMWDTVINVNLKSCFNTVKAATRTFMKQRSGSIINMTSVVGIKGNAGQSNYAASKSGIIGFTKSVALELGSRGIRCNAIAPGFIETEMTAVLDEKMVQSWRDAIPLKRGGTTDDVADCTVFLASDMSTYITGQVIQVDGGMLT